MHSDKNCNFLTPCPSILIFWSGQICQARLLRVNSIIWHFSHKQSFQIKIHWATLPSINPQKFSTGNLHQIFEQFFLFTADSVLLVVIINTLMIFWPILGHRKTSLVVFLWKRRKILFLIAWYKLLEIILCPKRQLNSSHFSYKDN